MQDLLSLFLPFALLIAFFYFIVIRPQSKRMREQQEALSAMQPGDRVVLHSGIFATISHVGDNQMILELAPGVEVTVLKGAVSRKAKDSEEEFEFADDVADTDDIDTPDAVTGIDAVGDESAPADEAETEETK